VLVESVSELEFDTGETVMFSVIKSLNVLVVFFC